MARTYGNFTDFIDFSRASSGTALRKVSYGAELVDTANTASAWTPYATNTVEQDSDAVKITYVSDSRGAYIYMDEAGGLSSDMTVGKTYRLTFQAKINTGNATVTLYDGVTNLSKNISSTSYVSVAHNFVYPSGLRPFMYIKSNLGSGEIIWIKNVSLKEVTFDQADGTLELFNHPAGIPRIEYDANGNELGLLIEEQRTNLVTYSSEFSNPYWTKYDTVLSDGPSALGLTSNTLTRNSTAYGGVFLYNGTGYTVSSGTDYVISALVKAGSGVPSFDLKLDTSGGGGYPLDSNGVGVTVEEDGSFSSLDAGFSSKHYGNGWYLISATATSTTTGGIQYGITGSSNWTLGGSLHVAYIQLEQGSFATSYIPTSGATATRSADIASIATANFGYNPKAGTIVVEFQASDWTNDQRYVVGSNTSSARWVYSNNGITSVTCYDGTSKLDGGTLTASQVMKVAVSTSKTEKVLSLNGGVQSNATDGSMASSTTDFFIGSLSGQPQNSINGHIKSIKYRPRRNTNTQLQEFTS